MDFRIGLTAGSMTELSSLGLPEPNIVPVHYAEQIALGNARVKPAGWLQCSWSFFHLTAAQVNTLRAFCPEPAQSAAVYIKTVVPGGGMRVYSAIMVWPQVEPAGVGGTYDDFEVTFHALQEVST